jgi:hypothetical protein
MSKGKAIFISQVEGGKLARYQEDIASALSQLEGKWVEVTIAQVRRPRSLNQNAYYFGVVLKYILAILHADGNTEMDLLDAHEFCKQKDIGNLEVTKMIMEKEGLVFRIYYRSTTSLTTMEFEAYLDRVRHWALTVAGVVIPLPNEELDQHYIEPYGI